MSQPINPLTLAEFFSSWTGVEVAAVIAGGVRSLESAIPALGLVRSDPECALSSCVPPNLGLADGAACLDGDDDGVVHVDHVARGTGEEGVPLHCAAGSDCDTNLGFTLLAAPLASSSSVSRYSRTERRFLAVASQSMMRPFRRALPVRVRPDQARIDRKSLAANQPFLNASAHGRLEQLAQEIAVAEATVPVLGEGRVVRDIAF